MSSMNQSYAQSRNDEYEMNNEEREKKKHFLKEENLRMLDDGVRHARTLIIQNHASDANDHMFGLLQKVREILDESTIELLPAYFIMAEANVIMGGEKLKKAEQLLIAAYWNLLKHTSEDNKATGEDTTSDKEASRYRASLHKTFGRLFTAQDRLDDAIDELSKGIYLECVQHGPESIQLCSLYYYLASIFHKQGKKIETKSFYQKIVEIWKKHILESISNEEADMENDYENEQDITEEELLYQEAKEHLKNILGFFEVEFGPQHALTAECDVAFALVMLKTHNDMIAGEFLEKAHYILMNSLGEFDPKTKEVEELAKRVEEMQRMQNDQDIDEDEH